MEKRKYRKPNPCAQTLSIVFQLDILLLALPFDFIFFYFLFMFDEKEKKKAITMTSLCCRILNGNWHVLGDNQQCEMGPMVMDRLIDRLKNENWFCIFLKRQSWTMDTKFQRIFHIYY